jgi:hypothetical protein
MFDRTSGLFLNGSVFCIFPLTNIQYANTLQSPDWSHNKEVKYTQIQVGACNHKQSEDFEDALVTG